MFNLLTAAQVRTTDEYTILNQGISSIDLMERAAKAFTEAFLKKYPDKQTVIAVYCGTGNNGGDGLAIARLLYESEFLNIAVKIAYFNQTSSADFSENLLRLQATAIPISSVKPDDLTHENAPVLIDALLGSGLNKPLLGNWAKLVNSLNLLHKQVISVDIPTGFSAEGEIQSNAIVLKANHVITFQRPKINFFFPESAAAMDSFEVVEIGLDEIFMQAQNSGFSLIQQSDISCILKPRKPFTYKGTYGHALIIAGQENTMGAALLCAEACVQSGAGLTTACIPQSGLTALNIRLPEAMAMLRSGQFELPNDISNYSAVAIGPGLGTNGQSETIFRDVLQQSRALVIDADGLNILAKHPELQKQLPAGTILTPHMKEFDRLFGPHKNWWARVQTAKQKAVEMNCCVVLKNRYTFIISAEGEVYINPTGSPAMATGGMGDALSGILVSLKAQGYGSLQAATAGVFIHGKCGQNYKGYVCKASALIKRIPKTFKKLLANN